MIKISAVYENVDGCSFDKEYYIEKHIPLAKAILAKYGLVRMEADIFESIEDILPAKYFAMTHAFFEDGAPIATILSQEGMAEIVSDVVNYTDVTPTLQTSRVIESKST